MTTLGDLASEMEVPVHSHICQQKEEVTNILYNYPQHRDCASIFDAAGMLNSRVCMIIAKLDKLLHGIEMHAL